jgi:hypothetical protein
MSTYDASTGSTRIIPGPPDLLSGSTRVCHSSRWTWMGPSVIWVHQNGGFHVHLGCRYWVHEDYSRSTRSSIWVHQGLSLIQVDLDGSICDLGPPEWRIPCPPRMPVLGPQGLFQVHLIFYLGPPGSVTHPGGPGWVHL